MVRRLGLVAVALALVGVAVWYATRPEPLAVVAARVERGRVESTVANTRAGTISACRRARLSPTLGGTIARLPVKEGDRVEEGQLLLELWSEDLAAEVRLAEAQARAAPLRASEVCQRARVAEREAKRLGELHRAELVSEEAFDRARSEGEALAAACQAAETDLRQSRARVDAARATLDRTVLKAPFAGVVAEVTGEVGEYTTPSPPGIPTPPAVDLIDDSCFYVTAPIDEVDAPHLEVGMTARVGLDAFPDRRIPGHVRRIAPYVLDREKQARTVDVEVELDDPADAGALLVGYSADVEIVLDAHDRVLRLPTQALLEGNRALVVGPAGRLGERKVEVGLSNWEYTEVRGGLGEGDRVVTSLEREGVEAGALVRVEEGGGKG